MTVSKRSLSVWITPVWEKVGLPSLWSERCYERVLNPFITVIPVVLSFSVSFLTLFCAPAGVERVPRQAGGLPGPAAPLGPRNGEVEI